MSTEKNDVQVSFTIQLPDGVPFIGQTVNGEIEAFRVASDLVLDFL